MWMPIPYVINFYLYELGLTMLNTRAESCTSLRDSSRAFRFPYCFWWKRRGHRRGPEFMSWLNLVPMTLTNEYIRRYKDIIALRVIRLAGPAYSGNLMRPYFSAPLQVHSYLVAPTRFVRDGKVWIVNYISALVQTVPMVLIPSIARRKASCIKLDYERWSIF